VVRFHLNDQGDLIRADNPSRPHDIPGGYAHAPWDYSFSDHRELSGVRVPATAIVSFEKGDGRWEYFRGSITSFPLGNP
jgi:hypothetical protein